MKIQPYLPGFKPPLPYPNVDGWPVLNTGHPGRDGYQSGWIHRRLYPNAEAGLQDARLGANLAGVTLYVIKMKVDPAFQRYWPEPYCWRISMEPPPLHSLGSVYYPRPDYYTIDPIGLLGEVFTPGERGQ